MLKGHYGCVKGVAWDPFNCYLATQGEQDGVFIWRVGDWSLVSKIQEPFGSALATTCFHARLGWSPDGQKLAATMGYDKPVFQAPLIERNQWDAWPEHQYCGHKRPVCVAKFNPHLFYPRKVGLRLACLLKAALRTASATACTTGPLGWVLSRGG